MDLKGQTTVLSAIFVLVGMMFLVPVITGKALATVHATASGVCGAFEKHPCNLIWTGQDLYKGKWVSEPTKEGTVVTWSTEGNPQPGDEKGVVTYKIGRDRVNLLFDNPLIGTNKCSVTAGFGTCTAGSGYNAAFTYKLEGR